ncbi:hypothetical protein CBR_g61501 [Chara braunii]|uniref:Conserved oligomeric Golgi complex subunit 6 n=1 Tax=Chara braunii TaxID=69332 RepID=A0A388K8S6_CHABU|nr:hypothetical protein CBR_g61501 [Chara braunii]|eukprot:GBG66458.1 hypothetical protein CBR_g61501 [Chara braunii]
MNRTVFASRVDRESPYGSALDAVETEVGGLSACCERISASLNSCSALTGNMVAATERLKQELDNVTNRQEEVSTFLHNYQLTPEEVSALRDEELDEGFFKALSRVQEIHANCKVLLRTHHQRAGLELMDVMAVYQEGAYERLCRWVQTECRSLGDNDTPEVSELLKTAARSLRERPVLFKYCAEEADDDGEEDLEERGKAEEGMSEREEKEDPEDDDGEGGLEDDDGKEDLEDGGGGGDEGGRR